MVLSRLYYQMSSNSSNLPRLCRLACGMPNLDICDVEKNPKSNNVGYEKFLALSEISLTALVHYVTRTTVVQKMQSRLHRCVASTVFSVILPNPVPSSLTPHLWRVLPVLDPQVSLLFSRDLDSVVSAREAAAVAEFLRHPNATVHIMRDHRGHRLVMLGKLLILSKKY